MISISGSNSKKNVHNIGQWRTILRGGDYSKKWCDPTLISVTYVVIAGVRRLTVAFTTYRDLQWLLWPEMTWNDSNDFHDFHD